MTKKHKRPELSRADLRMIEEAPGRLDYDGAGRAVRRHIVLRRMELDSLPLDHEMLAAARGYSCSLAGIDDDRDRDLALKWIDSDSDYDRRRLSEGHGLDYWEGALWELERALRRGEVWAEGLVSKFPGLFHKHKEEPAPRPAPAAPVELNAYPIKGGGVALLVKVSGKALREGAKKRPAPKPKRPKTKRKQ